MIKEIDMWREISPYEIENAMKLIGKDWMLISAEKDGAVNTMTASWGCMGVLWNKPVCTAFIRPQRYTYEFSEAADKMTFSFFDESYRDALKFCGTKSGRDYDKFRECGLSYEIDDGAPIINEARLVIVCKKLYADDLKEECFLDAEPLANYKLKDYHRFYICEIEKVLKREDV